LADLKRDPERLHQAATLLEAENKKLIDKVLSLQARIDALEGRDPGTLQIRIAELEQQLSVRNQALFGDKSEKRNRAARRADKKKSQNGHGPGDQAELPRLEQVHTLDAAVETCPKCGAQLQEFAGQFEEADEVDVVERRFVLVKHKRQKYRCDCGCIETAEGPPKLRPVIIKVSPGTTRRGWVIGERYAGSAPPDLQGISRCCGASIGGFRRTVWRTPTSVGFRWGFEHRRN